MLPPGKDIRAVFLSNVKKIAKKNDKNGFVFCILNVTKKNKTGG